MSLLRNLDDAWVPRLAASLDRLARKFPKSPEPAGPLPVILRLRRIDDRWTAAGPLALLREVPQLGAVLIGALVLASSITAYTRRPLPGEGRPRTAVEQPTGDEGLTEGQLGPSIGEDVTAYVEGANERLRSVAVERPDGLVVGVIMFDDYLTPDAVRHLLGPIQARELYYRPPVATGIVRSVRVDDLVRDAEADFRVFAGLRAAEARELRKVAATIENDPAQKREHEKDAALVQREVTMLRGECRCVFAVVVRAQARLLADALQLEDVRTIDVGAVGADLGSFEITVLLPEETVTVTGGNQEL